MRFLLVFVLLIPVHVFAQSTLNQNDQFSETKLQYDIDGIETWIYRTRSEQEEALKTFTHSCLNELPQTIKERLDEIYIDSESFDFKTEVNKFWIRGYGNSYRCRLTVDVKYPEEGKFQFVYSDIIRKEPSTACVAIVRDLDTQASEIHLFDRRIYYEAAPGRNENVFTACQVLQIKYIQNP